MSPKSLSGLVSKLFVAAALSASLVSGCTFQAYWQSTPTRHENKGIKSSMPRHAAYVVPSDAKPGYAKTCHNDIKGGRVCECYVRKTNSYELCSLLGKDN